MARKVIIDCLSIVISEAAENKIQAGRVNSSNWLETKEAECEFENIPEVWKEINQPLEERVDMNPDGWKPEEQNSKEENLIQPFRSRNINTAPEPEKVPNVQPAGRAAEVDINKFKFKQIGLCSI